MDSISYEFSSGLFLAHLAVMGMSLNLFLTLLMSLVSYHPDYRWEQAFIDRVLDGDTVLTEKGERIRLLYIDAAELEQSCRDGRLIGKSSAISLQELVEKKKVVKKPTDANTKAQLQRRVADLEMAEKKNQ